MHVNVELEIYCTDKRNNNCNKNNNNKVLYVHT